MDFMKVFDQTLREIKREVNLKVLKVPEIEQKVLDATDDEPWGPHGTILGEIAQGTKKYTECQMIMNILWTRLAETGKNWRRVYKALAVIEFLVAHGSERAVDDIVEHTYQIASLSSFEYVDPSGKDVGINVRKKSETIVGLLNDKDKIQEARSKAAINRDKYIGLSSSGLACKSAAAASSGSSNFRSSSDRYRGYGNARDSYASSNDNYKVKDLYGEDKYMKTTRSMREPSRHGSKKQETPISVPSKTSTTASKTNKKPLSSSQNAPSNKYDNDLDDFDPRGISSSKPSIGSNQVDLFTQNFVDLSDEPTSLPTNNFTASVNNSPEVDLFADAAFVSNAPAPDSAPQTDVDLFASQPSPAVSTSMDLFASQPASSVTTTVDLFTAPDPVPQLDDSASKPDTTCNTFDPFAAIPMSNFDELCSSGELTSHTDPFGGNSHDHVTQGKTNGTSVDTNSLTNNGAFEVKSGIWADSLSRGLIDLNITAPTKVNLAGIGIIGGLDDGSESKDKGHSPSSSNMGMAMGVASGVSKPEPKSTSTPALDDDFFSSLSSQQNQVGSSQN